MSLIDTFFSVFTSPTFWGAIVGFVGVVITLLVNGQLQIALSREQEATTRKLEAERRAREAAVLRATLSAELEQLIKVNQEEIEWVTTCTRGAGWTYDYTWVPALEYYLVYRANLDKLGLLQQDEVSKLTRAVYVYQEHIGYIARAGEMFQPTAPQAGGNIGYSLEQQRRREDLISNLEAIVSAAASALEAIKSETHGAQPE